MCCFLLLLLFTAETLLKMLTDKFRKKDVFCKGETKNHRSKNTLDENMEPKQQEEEKKEDESTISNDNKNMMDIDLNIDNNNDNDEEPYRYVYEENTPETAEFMVSILAAMDNDENNEIQKEETAQQEKKQRSYLYIYIYIF